MVALKIIVGNGKRDSWIALNVRKRKKKDAKNT